MSKSGNVKARGTIPQHVKRAVIARDGNKCRICQKTKESEDLDFDHLYPFDLGGPTTVENIQRLCRTCNTSKGNRIQCRQCNHWMSPDKSRCSQCETPFPGSKYTKTLKGRLDRLFKRVGLVAVIGGAAGVLLIVLTSVVLLVYFVSRSGSADQATSVDTIVNESFNMAYGQPAKYKVVIPTGAKNARVVGGFKVTSGTLVSFYVVTEAQVQQWSGSAIGPSLAQREQTVSTKIRQALPPGTYYLLFVCPSPNTTVTVAAEFYSKYD